MQEKRGELISNVQCGLEDFVALETIAVRVYSGCTAGRLVKLPTPRRIRIASGSIDLTDCERPVRINFMVSYCAEADRSCI